jgi:hypothetical protein
MRHEVRHQFQPAQHTVLAANSVTDVERPAVGHAVRKRSFKGRAIVMMHVVFEQPFLAERPVRPGVAKDLVHPVVFPDGSIGLHVPLENAQSGHPRSQRQPLFSLTQILLGPLVGRDVLDNRDEVIR